MGYILDSLSEGDVAMVSDAGMPGIADSGHELIKTAIQRDIKVVPIPGPSVVITAVVVSGLPTDKFLYLGFLPAKGGNRRRFLESVADESATLITLESPHRLVESLNDIKLILGNRRVTVCRELTKIHEEIFRGTVVDAIEHFVEPRGEFVLVIEGRRAEGKPEMTPDIRERLALLLVSGITAKDAIASLSKETGLSKRELYQAWLTLKGG